MGDIWEIPISSTVVIGVLDNPERHRFPSGLDQIAELTRGLLLGVSSSCNQSGGRTGNQTRCSHG